MTYACSPKTGRRLVGGQSGPLPLLSLLLAALLLLAAGSPARVEAYTHQFTNSSGATRIKWPTASITIALSTSLSSPPGNIKPGSDVEGAARRALERWSQAAGITFNVVSTGAQSISAGGAGDGVSLITVAATPENASVFASGSQTTGRARLFFDPNTGLISEADVTVNPSLQYSTDGTPDTYDLESTFVHEIGHLLGLDHSGLVGATMQPQQVKNGFSNVAAASPRTISHDDRAGVRTLYNLPGFGGTVSGAVTTTAGSPVFGAHVWVESLSSGRVLAGTLSGRDGSYSVGDLPADDFRVVAEYLDGPVMLGNVAGANRYYNGSLAQAPFQAAEVTTALAPGAAGAAANLSVSAAAPTFNPRVLGAAGYLASAPLPLTPGARVRLYIGGEGLDQIPAANITSLTPFVTLDPGSIRPENFGTSYPVVSLDAQVADNAHVANYSLRFRANSGETQFLSGAIVVDPYTDEVAPQPIYTTNFFVRQQYRDFLTREPEAAGFAAWTSTLDNCSDVNNNPNCDRTQVSSGFFRSDEFQFKGFFVYRFYATSFGRRLSYAELIPDMVLVTGRTDQEVIAKREAFVADWVARPAFRSIYDSLSNQAYVDRLLQTAGVSLAAPDRRTGVTRDSLVGDLNAGAKTRARVLRDIVESGEVYDKEYNRAFAAMQYFGYLRRDPDAGGYDDWLRELDRNPNNYRVMVRGFIDSTEYRLRFGLQ